MTHITQAKRFRVYEYAHGQHGTAYSERTHGIIGHNIIYGYADMLLLLAS